jgi:hypothetical protein
MIMSIGAKKPAGSGRIEEALHPYALMRLADVSKILIPPPFWRMSESFAE